MYGKLVTKVSGSDTKVPSTSGLVLKIRYDSANKGLEKKIKNVKKKIPNASGLIKKIIYNIKLELSSEIKLLKERLEISYLLLLV